MVLPRAPAAAAAGLLVLLGVARTGAVQIGSYLSEADAQRFEAIGKGESNQITRGRLWGGCLSYQSERHVSAKCID